LGATALGVRGLSVTIPHKEAVLALCEPDAIAREVGAVNTLVFDGERPLGTNTDVLGFRALLEEVQPSRLARAVLLGAGGAARAVLHALASVGVGSVRVMNRRGLALTVAGTRAEGVAWSDAALAHELAAADLLIDATPRGLDPHAAAVDLSPLPSHARVLDLVVRKETTLIAQARSRGLVASTGTTMLLEQGAAAFERWTERSAPRAVMRAALEAALG
jgi:shikimate dehydrogenase